MTIPLGEPLPGTITVKGQRYKGTVAFNLQSWAFDTYEDDWDIFQRLRFLTPFEVEVEVQLPGEEAPTVLRGQASLEHLGDGMRFTGPDLA